MFKNYFKVAFRNFAGNKTYSLITVTGLAIAFAACLMITGFIRSELSFDRFHHKSDRIYRLNEIQRFGGIAPQHVALSMFPMGPAMLSEYPEIEAFTRVRGGPEVVEYGEKRIFLQDPQFVDPDFLTIFDFQLLAGKAGEVLIQPNQVVLTRSTARKLFGDDNPVGKSVQHYDEPYLVTGIVADPPRNSHLQFDALFSIATMDNERWRNSWGRNSLTTYFLLRPGTDSRQLETMFPGFLTQYVGEDATEHYTLYLQPLSEVHLGSTHVTHDYRNWQKFDGDYLYVFAFLGIFVLIVASINFMNITIARSTERAMEIGIRKSIGALRWQLAGQFIAESVFLVMAAMAIALLLAALFVPIVNDISGRGFDLTLSEDPVFGLVVFGVTLLVGVLAGIYPALVLSAFAPVKILEEQGRRQHQVDEAARCAGGCSIRHCHRPDRRHNHRLATISVHAQSQSRI